MILIFSEIDDITTDKVTEWLFYYKVPFLRLNRSDSIDILKSIKISNTESKIKFNLRNREYCLSDFKLIWHRRGNILQNIPDLQQLNIKEANAVENIKDFLHTEVRTLTKYVVYKMMEIPHLDNPKLYQFNKLIMLDLAKKAGLLIPNTFIGKDDKSIDKDKEYITKPIQDFMNFDNDKISIHLKVKVFKKNNTSFFHSLIQEKINKVYEVRSFIFLTKIYSIAIFSQENNKTKLDFRNYDKEKPNRMVPFQLPKEVEKKLLKLLKYMKIESGSADLIFDGKRYIFLEINPVGQLDFVSGYGNYYIEKHIAKYIKKKHEINK